MSESEMKPLGSEMSAEEWISLGKTCAENGMVFLLLTGGEPFLREDFREIYSSLRNLGLCVSVNTNASLISDSDIEFLCEERPESLNITLYGASNETYKKLCGTGKVFDKVIENIRKLKERDIPIRLNVSLTKDNISDLEEIVRIGNSLDIPLKITSYMFSPVRKAEGCQKESDVILNEKESGYARFLTMKYLMGDEIFGRIRQNFRKNDFSVGYHGECEELGSSMECMAGRSAFWVTWNGKLLPCGMINNISSDLKENGFPESWKYITKEISMVRMPAECSVCKAKNICRPCGAITFSESGDFSRKPQYLCDSTIAYIDFMKSDEM